MGTHLRALSESYPMNTNMTGFRCFSILIAFLSHGRKKPQHEKDKSIDLFQIIFLFDGL